VLNVLGRRGFSLLEIMIALTIMLVVGGALHSLVLVTQRLTRNQLQQLALQSSLRAGSLVVANELRELSSRTGSMEQSDIRRIGPSGVMYRAMRGTGFICRPPGPGTLQISRAGFSGHRDPQAGRDTAYVFIPGQSGSDSWHAYAITGVSNSSCPGGGPGISLTIPSTGVQAEVEVGTPVRIAEVMELRLYQSNGRSWLGARSVSAGEAIQPLAGPLKETSGFRLEYLNGTGSPTTDLTTIKSVKVTLRAQAEGPLEEELVSQVTLRNGLRH